jgi:hypothetical protein
MFCTCEYHDLASKLMRAKNNRGHGALSFMKTLALCLFSHKTTLVEKMASIHPISPQTVQSAAKEGISLGSFQNVG